MADENLKDWTVMVYMAGDNNLSEHMAFSLDDLNTYATGQRRPGEQSNVNLLAFFDGNALTAPTQYIDFSDGKTYKHPIERKDLYHRRRNTYIPDSQVREGNSASAYSIMNFVRWCIKKRKRKAKNYVLIFSGHSFGFHGTSFLRDGSSGGFITLFKFRWALEEINKLYLDDKKLAILGFDSCVMSMLEIGHELKDVAHTLVASEGSLPISGWSYVPLLNSFIPQFKSEIKQEVGQAFSNPEALKDLSRKLDYDLSIFLQQNLVETNSDPGLDIDLDLVMGSIVTLSGYFKEMVRKFVCALIDTHNKLLIGGQSIDMAAWDLDKINPVVNNLSALAAEFKRSLDLSEKIEAGPRSRHGLQETDIEIFQDLKKIILQSHFDTQTYMNEQCIDLKDFCQRFIIECKFMEKGPNAKVYTEFIRLAREIILSIEDCVLKSGFCGDEFQFSNGISLYFPWSHLTFSLTNNRYRYLKFVRGESRIRKDSDCPDEYTGLGKDWYFFLRHYIYCITQRQLRATIKKEGRENKVIKSALDDFSVDNPIWSKPIWSKDNPLWSKDNSDEGRVYPAWIRRDNPDRSMDNPDRSMDNPDRSMDNPDRGMGEMDNYLFYFKRFKNYQNKWDISGYSDEFKFQLNFDEEKEKPNKKE